MPRRTVVLGGIAAVLAVALLGVIVMRRKKHA